MVLDKLGQSSEAERWMDRAGDPRSGVGQSARDQLLLLRVFLQGVDTVGGRAALRELVRNGLDREVLSVALHLLANVESTLGQAEFDAFLNEMISEATQHPLLGQMYYLRSERALALGDAELAEADARFLLEQFPGLAQIDNVYRMFAFAALQRTPPQYRVAADFLNQLRDRNLPEDRRRLLDRLIGDCYFLKGDYADAADFYRSARNGAVSAEAEVITAFGDCGVARWSVRCSHGSCGRGRRCGGCARFGALAGGMECGAFTAGSRRCRDGT